MVLIRSEVTLSEGGLRAVGGRDPHAGAPVLGRIGRVGVGQVTTDRQCGRFKAVQCVFVHTVPRCASNGLVPVRRLF